MSNNPSPAAPPSSRSALQRLLIVLGIAAAVLLYARGWTVTDINLDEIEEPQRQDALQRALRELLSPDIFDQERESQTVLTGFRFNCDEIVEGETLEQAAPTDGSPYITVSPTCGSRGDMVTIEGFNFRAGAVGQLRWVPQNGQSRPLSVLDIGTDGYFKIDVEVPSIRGGSGIHAIEMEGSWPIGSPYFSDTTNEVVSKMVETVFLALMATTLALPLSIILGFLASRNLMRLVHMPLGSVLLAFVLLPVGWLLGTALLGPIGELGVRIGTGNFSGAGTAALLIFASSVTAGTAKRREIDLSADRLRGIAISIVALVAGIFIVGLLGGLAITLSRALPNNTGANFSDFNETFRGLAQFILTTSGDLGNMSETLGQLVQLSITAIAGVAGGIYVSSLTGSMTRDWMRHLVASQSHILGGVLGLLGGALLLSLVALTGTWAALLGLIAPVIAATLGGNVLAALYRRFVEGDTDGKLLRLTFRERATFQVIEWVGAIIGFLVTFIWLDIGRGIIDGRLPVEDLVEIGGFTAQTFVLKAAIIGAVLGGVGGSLAGIHRQIPIGMSAYEVTRTILNTLRSIEPLIMGIVFVIWVGIGPFAGVLALTLHSIASLGKLYSEQTEGIDPGPMEAMQATGATWLQMVMYGVVPQVIPPFTAFTLYRWDINVRMSTIIGFVGGGGIGFLLSQQINLLRYRDAGVAVLAIAIVVSVLDYASARIRERMI